MRLHQNYCSDFVIVATAEDISKTGEKKLELPKKILRSGFVQIMF